MANETRLIDAEKFKRVLQNMVRHLMEYAEEDKTAEIMANMIESTIKCLNLQPTVDAVEVVHGEWEITEDDYLSLVEMKCSVCGESYGFEWYEDVQPKSYHYCPNCGAKMKND